MDTLISNVTVVTMNERMEVLFGAYIGITQGKIVSISTTAPEQAPNTIVDGTGMVAIPGLINCHTHLAATGLRNLLDDAPRQEALEQLLQKEAKMDSRCAKAAVTLGVAECLRFGITSVSDLYYYPQVTAQVLAQAGMKGNVALSAYRFEDSSQEFDFETDPQCRLLQQTVDTWHNYDNGRIRIDGGLYAEYTGNHLLFESLSAYCLEKGLGMQLHLAETEAEAEECRQRTGLGPGELLNCHGVFRVPATCAGCVALEPEEAQLLGKKKASAVFTPMTWGKQGLAGGTLSQLVKAGMNVALGSGGAAECGSMDLFSQMRAAAMDARRAGGDANTMPSQAILMLATVCGARAQGRSDRCGMLKEGMDADIVLLDYSAPHLIPCHDLYRSLVFSAQGGDVAMTMVQGQILYQNGRFPTLDLQEAVQELTVYVTGRLFEAKE